jgi:phosphoribosylformimino-5-aminoimidazole carboxamide ribotide isomerase
LAGDCQTDYEAEASLHFERGTCVSKISNMFRPCIDLHEGKVKQIVGGTLGAGPARIKTNFVSERPASWFAELYKSDALTGGHVIMLGPGNETAARSALQAYPGGLQIGGGISSDNARSWLDSGASHIIVTSWIFRDGHLDSERLRQICSLVGKERLVLDLSCRRHGSDYVIVTKGWQKFTDLDITRQNLEKLSAWCAEFLIHAVDVEGLCHGIDKELVVKLAEWSPIITTYAGGANSLADLEEVTKIGKGRIHLTIGSALDIFGGTGVRYEEVIAFNRGQEHR